MLPVTLGLGLVFLLVAEGGFHLGRWHILRGDTTLKEHIGGRDPFIESLAERNRNAR